MPHHTTQFGEIPPGSADLPVGSSAILTNNHPQKNQNLQNQHQKTQKPTGRSALPGGRNRNAFTLIELLVVIGILVVLAGIGYGAILSTRRQEAHRAVTALVSDFIRQARHTAMSSGAPVEAVISLDEDGKARIRGFSQVSIIGEQFEGTNFPQKTIGHSGSGCAIGRTNPADPTDPVTHETFCISNSATQPINILLRPTSSASISFYLECTVCPLPVLWPNPLPSGSTTNNIPLVLKDGDQKLLAMMLVPLPPTNAIGIQSWNYQVEFPDNIQNTHTAILPTGSWTRIGVLWKQDACSLFVDGWELRFPPSELTLSNTPDLSLQIGDTTSCSAAIVDNVRLYRLGGGEDFPLPAGFVPHNTYRFLFNPDGTVSGDDMNPIISSDKTGQLEKIDFSISPSGSVSSSSTTIALNP